MNYDWSDQRHYRFYSETLLRNSKMCLTSLGIRRGKKTNLLPLRWRTQFMMGVQIKVQVVKNIQTTAARLNKNCIFISSDVMPNFRKTWVIELRIFQRANVTAHCNSDLAHLCYTVFCQSVIPRTSRSWACYWILQMHTQVTQAYFLHYEVPVYRKSKKKCDHKIVICLENELLNTNNCCMVSIFVIFKQIPFEHTVFSWNMPNFVSNSVLEHKKTLEKG